MTDPTPTERLVLELLGSEERSGLELIRLSSGRLKRGSIYVVLTSLEGRGFVQRREGDDGRHFFKRTAA